MSLSLRVAGSLPRMEKSSVARIAHRSHIRREASVTRNMLRRQVEREKDPPASGAMPPGLWPVLAPTDLLGFLSFPYHTTKGDDGVDYQVHELSEWSTSMRGGLQYVTL